MASRSSYKCPMVYDLVVSSIPSDNFPDAERQVVAVRRGDAVVMLVLWRPVHLPPGRDASLLVRALKQ